MTGDPKCSGSGYAMLGDPGASPSRCPSSQATRRPPRSATTQVRKPQQLRPYLFPLSPNPQRQTFLRNVPQIVPPFRCPQPGTSPISVWGLRFSPCQAVAAHAWHCARQGLYPSVGRCPDHRVLRDLQRRRWSGGRDPLPTWSPLRLGWPAMVNRSGSPFTASRPSRARG